MAKKARKSGNKRKVRKMARTGVSRVKKAVRPVKRRPKLRQRRVKVVRSRSTRARKPTRPLPPAEVLSERLFFSSLERSLRDNRLVWEALAKK